jgi:hypothetical protein
MNEDGAQYWTLLVGPADICQDRSEVRLIVGAILLVLSTVLQLPYNNSIYMMNILFNLKPNSDCLVRCKYLMG